VTLTHHIRERQRLTEADRVCLTVPLFHCFGMVCAVMAVLAPGRRGSLGHNITKGYCNMPEAAAPAVDADGRLRPWDLGSLDTEGYFKITGQIKDLIIRGGENISPREIEEYLRRAA
jgi:acyl-CoA synthetase (AMP-forming)/AMP-acid ligase II